jgi:hypothetical protein
MWATSVIFMYVTAQSKQSIKANNQSKALGEKSSNLVALTDTQVRALKQ